jgi:2-C-methyl-D-erythritol 4-phosphate cytidylyltransferase
MEGEQPEKEPVLINTRAVDRSLFRIIQTPQTFRTSLIKQAYAIPEDATLTDDASVFERAGFPVYLFEGSYRNIKVTTPEDLLVAQAFLNERRSE